jgi:quinol monooxygenase YgiN
LDDGTVSLTLIPVFAIRPGRLDDFKSAAAQISERTNAESGTLRYEQFISEDGARALNVEVFVDPDAFVTHRDNVADLVPALLDAGPVVHIDVLGDVTEAFRAELTGDVTYLTRLGHPQRSGPGGHLPADE